MMDDTTDPEFEQALDMVSWTVARHRNYGRQRARNVISYCRRMGLSLSQVVVERHDDFSWANRRNRTARERKAEIIGYTNSNCGGYPLSVFWVLPKEE